MLAASGGGVLLLLCVSNLNGMWELLSHLGIGTTGFYEWLGIKGVDLTDGGSGWRPEGWWWWWSSSRVINTFTADGTGVDFTIQEFPFFSLMLGDLHPHLMSIPFVLLSLTLLANLVFSRDRWGWGWFPKQPGDDANHGAGVRGVGFHQLLGSRLDHARGRRGCFLQVICGEPP